MATHEQIAAVARNYPVRAAFVERVWLPEFGEQQVRVILDMLIPVGVCDAAELQSWASVMAYWSVDDMLRAIAEMVRE